MQPGKNMLPISHMSLFKNRQNDPAGRTVNLVWKALSDPTRRNVLDLLRDGPRTTGDICARFRSLSRFAVMKHLRILEQTRLVVPRRQGRFRWNHLNPDPILRLEREWIQRYRGLAK